MTTAIQFADTRTASLRDTGSKRSNQPDDSGQGFQDALGGASDSSKTSADTSKGGKAMTPFVATTSATTTDLTATATAPSPTILTTSTTADLLTKPAADNPALQSLIEQTSAAAESGKTDDKGKGPAKAVTDDPTALPAAQVQSDPASAAVNAGLLAMTAGVVPVAPPPTTATPISAKSAALSALGLSNTPSTAAAGITGSAAQDVESLGVKIDKTIVSDVKVTTHLATGDGLAKAGVAAVATRAAAKDDPTVFVMPETLTPSQAVASVVTVALPQASAVAASGAAEPVQTQVIAPPRTMTLQLTPPDLGTVSVTMNLSGQSLDLQLSVSDKDTLSTISRDRDALSKAVEGQGYELRSLTIQSSESSGAAAGDANAGARDSSANQQQQQSGSDRQASQSGNGAGNGSQRGPQSQRMTSDDTPRAPADSGGGGLFV